MKESFKTIHQASEGFFKDKGSKFHGYAFPVADENQISDRLSELRKLHPKARHFCYAWKLGLTDYHFRANDDGEPSGTAGRPILGQIEKYELTDVLIVVVRYFGGTLLGTGGLIHAYRTCAEDTILSATIIEEIVCFTIRLEYDYSMTSDIMHVLKVFDLKIESQDFNLPPSMRLRVPVGLYNSFWLQLKAQLSKVSLEEAETMESVTGLNMEKC